MCMSGAGLAYVQNVYLESPELGLDIRSPEAMGSQTVVSSCVYWEFKLGLSQEQQILLAIELPLQFLHHMDFQSESLWKIN